MESPMAAWLRALLAWALIIAVGIALIQATRAKRHPAPVPSPSVSATVTR